MKRTRYVVLFRAPKRKNWETEPLQKQKPYVLRYLETSFIRAPYS